MSFKSVHEVYDITPAHVRAIDASLLLAGLERSYDKKADFNEGGPKINHPPSFPSS